MGLKDYRKYQKRVEVLEALASFGITEDDLKHLHGALAIVKDLKSRADERPSAASKPTEEETKEMKRRQESALKPEDIVSMFADDAEEFYPNGRSKQS